MADGGNNGVNGHNGSSVNGHGAASFNGNGANGNGAPPPVNRGRGFMGIFDTGVFVGTFSLLTILLAGIGFIYKLYEFIKSARGDEGMLFAIMPITTYLIVAGGFMCLFIWAFLSGKFADLEAAKYDMLEQEEAYERAERASAHTN